MKISQIQSEQVHSVSQSYDVSKWKIHALMIVIIAGLSGLAVGIDGLIGYFHLGRLNYLNQITAMTMMTIGGSCGIILLGIGIRGAIKNRHQKQRKIQSVSEAHKLASLKSLVNTSNPSILSSVESFSSISSKIPVVSSSMPSVNGDLVDSNIIHPLRATDQQKIIRSIDTKGGLEYGPEAWKIWGIEVLDEVPEAPTVDLSKKDKVLIYIPKRIKIGTQEKNLTLDVLKEIGDGLFKCFLGAVVKQHKHLTSYGWILISKELMANSQGKNYETQKLMVKEKNCRMPNIVDAIVLNLMVYSFTDEKLWGSSTYTYCNEYVEVNGKKIPVVVGDFGFEGLSIFQTSQVQAGCGVACVWPISYNSSSSERSASSTSSATPLLSF